MLDLERSINQKIQLPSDASLELYVKREDALHTFVSGNKYRKLKYNMKAATEEGHTTLLTFGGAYSNHIAAVASAGRQMGFNTIGIIRGEELVDKVDENPTLKFAKDNGMVLDFVTREDYRQKTSLQFLERLQTKYGFFYNIPEGGTNSLAVKGCEEILSAADSDFDVICCPVGTGGTISGLINCSKPSQQVLGFPALKANYLHKDISKFVSKSNWQLVSQYHFGGYAKVNVVLIDFINTFAQHHGVLLDPIYTGKMMFGIMDMIKTGFFKRNTKILAIHTGGLQGIIGMNNTLKLKNLPQIQLP